MDRYLLLLLIFSLCCCEAKLKDTLDNEIGKNNSLNLTIALRVSESNTIRVFYVTNSLNGSYGANEVLYKKIFSSDSIQTLKFNLPFKDLSKFRIDLGEEYEFTGTPIYIDKITIERNNESIEIESNIIESFFEPNIYLQRNGKAFSRMIINGKYDPYLESKPILFKKIKIEL